MALPSHHSACLLQRSYQEGLHVAALPQHSLRQRHTVRSSRPRACASRRSAVASTEAASLRQARLRVSQMYACMHVLC